MSIAYACGFQGTGTHGRKPIKQHACVAEQANFNGKREQNGGDCDTAILISHGAPIISVATHQRLIFVD